LISLRFRRIDRGDENLWAGPALWRDARPPPPVVPPLVDTFLPHVFAIGWQKLGESFLSSTVSDWINNNAHGFITTTPPRPARRLT